MIVLSHRGFWLNNSEKNTKLAFERSFSKGFGTETDIRDYNGELVISHDIANSQSMPLTDFFDIFVKYDKELYLALNIKADGLQQKLKKILEEYKIQNYFLFDMSVPDGLICIKNNLKVFTRESEYEKQPSFYYESDGVWLDSFIDEWIDEKVINKHLNNAKKACIVSPDLHKRAYKSTWQRYITFKNNDNVLLCTDHPDEAQEFFKN